MASSENEKMQQKVQAYQNNKKLSFEQQILKEQLIEQQKSILKLNPPSTMI